MSYNSFLSPKLMAGAALVGLVGAAGVFIYEQVYAEKRRAMLVSEVQRLDRQMSSMRKELEALRELQKETQLKRAARQKRVRKTKMAGGDTVDAAEPSYASDSEYFTDYQSIVGTDGELDSEEFYDVHTDESDDTLKETRNGHAGPSDLDEDLSDRADVSPKSSPRKTT
ncbi:uncharacterized protein LOC126379276 [Pectinophora gossypiella]|uniref:Uncharacterized protein n=1 Tax=Pectinophora gossypiella TaxID=13191 RepID=A0A1E1WQP0_PECGO|nr:uncharacterized protein LOC126379276 [Pectinophora gossypiella]